MNDGDGSLAAGIGSGSELPALTPTPEPGSAMLLVLGGSAVLGYGGGGGGRRSGERGMPIRGFNSGGIDSELNRWEGLDVATPEKGLALIDTEGIVQFGG